MTIARHHPRGFHAANRDALPEVLFDGDEVQLLHFPAESDYSLVTFHIMHSKATGRSAFADKLAAKNGIDLYGIMPKSPNWYPQGEMEEVTRIVADRLDRPAIAYGSSMGGYGALRYGRAAGCQTALAFSPQTTIDPGITGENDPRYDRYFRADVHGDMAVRAADLCDRTTIALDPRAGFDAFQVGLLPQTSCVDLIPLHHTGHTSVEAMASSATATTVFRAALAGDSATIRRALHKTRNRSLTYHVQLAAACSAQGRPETAIAITRRAIAARGATHALRLTLAEAQSEAGHHLAAVSEVRQLVDDFPHIGKFRTALVRIAANTRDDDTLIDALKETIAGMEHFTFYWRLLQVLLQVGRRDEAQEWAEKAIALWPERAVPIRMRLAATDRAAAAKGGPTTDAPETSP